MDTSTRSRSRRILRRGVAGAVAATAALIASGITYQSVGDALDRSAAPAPGRFVEVEGHRMHLHCTGEGRPTVILEAGATGFAQTWAWIQPELSRTTRVCSYDRPGMGWSEDRDTDHDALTLAQHLRTLLDVAGESGPYVMVGHSLGGPFVQAFTGLFGEEVVGVGLVDPSHPDQLDRFGPEIRAQQETFHGMIAVASRLAPLGVLRATNVLGRNAEGLPESDYRSARMHAASATHLRTSHAELAAWDRSMDAVRRVTSLGSRPTVVISATETMEGMPDGFIDINHDMHAELAHLSTRGHHVKLGGTDHFSLLMVQEHALQTAGILRRLVEEVRAVAPASVPTRVGMGALHPAVTPPSTSGLHSREPSSPPAADASSCAGRSAAPSRTPADRNGGRSGPHGGTGGDGRLPPPHLIAC